MHERCVAVTVLSCPGQNVNCRNSVRISGTVAVTSQSRLENAVDNHPYFSGTGPIPMLQGTKRLPPSKGRFGFNPQEFRPS
ncbi:hypothetical protein PGT21_025000 [Puccinia graminis f. sp. tritici]|uniref:Uncharacterized protein n=1 Tax=Puccinia graminis f. sp. tritici TaxID=56615 RepID=A0A5B0MV58_PUCGR|nr:hypothetical protein PGT21_025000 [Puccinia graminis f. sp. tritici]KAA1137049.1 hypothetical protein PGTUg99_013609 [Puccinia graminis f. sp. tritici]